MARKIGQVSGPLRFQVVLREASVTALPAGTSLLHVGTKYCVPLATDSCEFYCFHPVTLSPAVKKGMPEAGADSPFLSLYEFALRAA